jgi:hypothetical protein
MSAGALPVETRSSEPVRLDAPVAGGFAGAAPLLPGVGVDPVREPPLDDPEVEEPLLETFVRMNSAPARLASPVRDDEPAAVDPLDPVAPPG